MNPEYLIYFLLCAYFISIIYAIAKICEVVYKSTKVIENMVDRFFEVASELVEKIGEGDES